MSSLASRLIKSAGKKSLAVAMSASNYGEKTVIAQTQVPILNVMMGGSLDGGITCGVTQVVGDSRTFKSNLLVEIGVTFIEANPEAVVIVFDCEFGIMKAFENRVGANKALLDRIVHVPFEDIEDMKFQLVKMLEDVQRNEPVMFIIDSISQVASKKEVENSLNDNSAADMTRAREMNSFFRMVTPKLNLRNIPLYAINSFYDDTSSQWAEPIIKGGKQSFLSSDNIWFVTRSQDKDDATKELLGWNFNYSMMKSRFCKEKAKMTIHVTYAGGIDPLSGLVELARESGHLLIPTQGFYQFNAEKLGPNTPDKKFRLKEIMATPELFQPVLKSPSFREFVADKFSLSNMTVGVQKVVEFDEETGEVKE